MEAGEALLFVTEVKGPDRETMINVPNAAVVLPRHAGLELAREMSVEVGWRAADQITVAVAFGPEEFFDSFPNVSSDSGLRPPGLLAPSSADFLGIGFYPRLCASVEDRELRCDIASMLAALANRAESIDSGSSWREAI